MGAQGGVLDGIPLFADSPISLIDGFSRPGFNVGNSPRPLNDCFPLNHLPQMAAKGETNQLLFFIRRAGRTFAQRPLQILVQAQQHRNTLHGHTVAESYRAGDKIVPALQLRPANEDIVCCERGGRCSILEIENMTDDSPELSVVIPCHNEEANLRALFQAIEAALHPPGVSYEIVVTDDGSTDRTWELLKQCAAKDGRIRAQRFTRNYGQSAALWAGVKAARGTYLVTLDSDLQNDPKDLPAFLRALERFDCVCGSRVAARRQGDSWVRVASSRIANWVRNKVSGEQVSDAGCTFRAFKRECVAELKFFKGMHRFLPTLIKMEGFTVTEIAIAHHPRTAGQTHYGISNRLFAAFYDLLAVRWMKQRMFRWQIAERSWVNLTDGPPSAPKTTA